MARRSPIATSQTAPDDGPWDGEVTFGELCGIWAIAAKQDGSGSAGGAFNPRSDHKGERHQICSFVGLPR
jgi:hypothetical protein